MGFRTPCPPALLFIPSFVYINLSILKLPYLAQSISQSFVLDYDHPEHKTKPTTRPISKLATSVWTASSAMALPSITRNTTFALPTQPKGSNNGKQEDFGRTNNRHGSATTFRQRTCVCCRIRISPLRRVHSFWQSYFSKPPALCLGHRLESKKSKCTPSVRYFINTPAESFT